MDEQVFAQEPKRDLRDVYERREYVYFPDEDLDFDDPEHMPGNMVQFVEIINQRTGQIKRIVARLRAQVAAIVDGQVRDDLPKRAIEIPPFLVPGDTIHDALKNLDDAKAKALTEVEEQMNKDFKERQDIAVEQQNVNQGKSKGGIILAQHGRQPNNPNQLHKGKRRRGKRF